MQGADSTKAVFRCTSPFRTRLLLRFPDGFLNPAPILGASVCLPECQMEEEAFRWNLNVSSETDLTLRTFLGARGMKKGDRNSSKKHHWRVFHYAVQDIKS